MKRTLVAVAAGLVLLVPVLTGCDGGDGDDQAGAARPHPSASTTTPSPSTADATSSPSSTPAPPAPPVPTLASGIPDSLVVTRGDVAPAAGQDAAAAAAAAAGWFAYWEVRSAAFHAAAVDPVALGAVAEGQASEAVTGYVATLQAGGLHTVGTVTVRALSVAVDGGAATLVGCLDNGTVDVTAAGSPAEIPQPAYAFTGTLRQAGGTWLVGGLQPTGLSACAPA